MFFRTGLGKQALLSDSAATLKTEAGAGDLPTSSACGALHSRGAAVRAPLST